MGNYRIIADVGQVLVNRLRQALSPELIKEKEFIALCTPSDFSDFILSLVLYDIRTVDKNLYNGKSNSTACTLSYILIANSNASSGMKALEEHSIISKAIETFSGAPIIKNENNFLSPNDFPILVHMNNVSLDEKLKILSAVSGSTLRTSAFYSVSPIFIDGRISEKGSKVSEF